MIAKVNGQDTNIPTSWADVPFKKYIEFLDCTTNLEQASCLTGIDMITLHQLNSEGLGAIMMLLSFMHEAPNAYLDEAKQKEYDINRDTYGKLEMAKAQLIMNSEKPYKALIEIAKVYTGVDYSDVPTDEANPVCAFFFIHSIIFSRDINGLGITNQA
jgi:hypothetical protein